MVIDSGGIDIKPPQTAEIFGKGKITSDADFIDIKFHRNSKAIDGIFIHSVISDSQHKVGLRLAENSSGTPNGLIIKGSESNTYTGDTIISGLGNFLGLKKENGAIATQGNILAEKEGVLRFDGSNQLSKNSVVTLRNGAIAHLGNIKKTLSNSIHQLHIEEVGRIDFGGQPGYEQILYIDDLVISDGSILQVVGWEESCHFLLIRKDSAHLKDALKKINFVGYDRNAIHLENYNKDYWSINATPEPATYGATLGALSLGLFIYRKKNKRESTGLRLYVNGVDMGLFDPKTLGPPPPPEVVARREAASKALKEEIQ